jgi:hypothetical protein
MLAGGERPLNDEELSFRRRAAISAPLNRIDPLPPAGAPELLPKAVMIKAPSAYEIDMSPTWRIPRLVSRRKMSL